MSRDHVCLAGIDWGYLWQGPQEVMSRFARAGGKVIYVNHAGIRRPHLEDWRRIAGRVRDWASRPRGGAVPGVPGVTVISPMVLPFPWSRTARRVNRTIFADRLPGMARNAGLDRPVIWSFVPTPFAIDSLRSMRGRRAAAVYYCVQDFALLSGDPQRMRDSEDEMLREVDVVFSGGRVLHERLASRHPRVTLAPFAVGDGFFSDPQREPADIRTIPRPRVVYVGGLHRFVDRALLADVLSRSPRTSFVFIGPKVSGDWEIERASNAYFIGRRPYVELPAYIDASDVALVPYEVSPYTETVWPTKLHEYLARGRPVVSTPLPEVQRLGYDDRDVASAATGQEMAAAIERLIADAGSRSDVRRDLAREYSWERTLARMTEEIERVAGDD